MNQRILISALALSSLALVTSCGNRHEPSDPVVARQSSLTLDFGRCSKKRVDVSVGLDHTCVLLSDRTVECWGDNSSGQVGTGSTSASPILVPTAVPGLADVVSLSAGSHHTCALLSNGSVRCWGFGGQGQLGAGSLTDSPAPQVVPGVANVTAVASGDSATCAVRADGTVACWGRRVGTPGQPATVPGLGNATAVAVGKFVTCALKSDHSVWCWTEANFAAVQVQGLGNATTISNRVDSPCALIDDGTVWCWGSNDYGQIGLPAAVTEPNGVAGSSTPVKIPTIAGATWLSVGYEMACAGTGPGTSLCWGNNQWGLFGYGGTGNVNTHSTPIAGPTHPLVSFAQMTACGLGSDGVLKCWGKGMLGDGQNRNTIQGENSTVALGGTGVSSAGQVCGPALSACDIEPVCDGSASACPPAPAPPQGAPACPACSLTPSEPTAGGNHVCALVGDGHVECWGDNAGGQLGNGTTTDSALPLFVRGLYDAVAIDAGNAHTCAVRANGAGVVCWGYSQNGGVGSPTIGNIPLPNPVPNLTNVSAVAAGYAHSCALHFDGTIDCWGRNLEGQLGKGTNPCPPCQDTSPVRVVGITNAVSIATGYYFTCAVRASGGVQCWGDNQAGQLGTATSLLFNSASPVDVPGITNAIAVSAGSSHACALLSDQTVKCWGRGTSGELGNGDFASSPTPVAVVGLTDVVAIDLGPSYSCARGIDGNLACWGYNGGSQLEDAVFGNTAVPIDLPHITGATDYTAGALGGCARVAGGAIKCWGNGSDGQLGNGEMTGSRTPVTIQCTAGAAIGQPCTATPQCSAGVCVDGVCCADACGGGDLSDCMACSRAKGGQQDGTCTPLNTFPVCRTSAGDCDPEERCQPSSTTCPANAFWQNDTVCRPAFGVCDVAEFCQGTATCPPDVLVAQGTVCSNTDPCDTVEVCSGTPYCPLWTAIPGCGGTVGGTINFDGIPVTGLSASRLEVEVAGSNGVDTPVPDALTGHYGSATLRHGRYFVITKGITCERTENTEILTLDDVDIQSNVATTKDVDLADGSAWVVGQAPTGAFGPTTIVLSSYDTPCDGLATQGTSFAGFFAPGTYTIAAKTSTGAVVAASTFSVVAGTSLDLGTLALVSATQCATPDDCGGGPCVDGYCCDTACGDGDANDCDACSVNAGGTMNGICSSLPSCKRVDVAECSSNCGDQSNWVVINDPSMDGYTVTVKFPAGMSAGNMRAARCSADTAQPPSEYTIVGGNNPACWDITTTVTYPHDPPPPPPVPELTVCITYPPDVVDGIDDLRLLQLGHFKNGSVSMTRTAGPVGQICGTTPSLSPFAILMPTKPVFPNPPGTIVAYATTAAGAAVTYPTPTATAASGPPTVSCTPASGSTFPLGQSSVTCTAIGKGGTATAPIPIWVQVQAPTDGSFFLAPINSDDSSVFKVGSTIAVKFKLTGASAPIGNLTARLSVTKISSSVSGTELEATSTSAADGGNLFRYDATAHQYMFNLSTKSMSAGTWALRADLGDGVTHEVKVSLKGK